ncbi:hypothetical protein Tco_0852013 [Tanacetum coccineum]
MVKTRLFKAIDSLIPLDEHLDTFRVDVVIDRYDNTRSTSLSSPNQPSVIGQNLKYSELKKELEREKRKYEMIQQEKIGKSSYEFVLWFEQDIEGIKVEELEQYIAALVELKRKALVRAGDLANMENASMLSLGPSSYWNNLPNAFDNAPFNMQVFGDEIKIQNNTINGIDFGYGIKFENNTINVPTSYIDFGDGIKFVSNTMNRLKNGLDFGDGIKFENNTMDGLIMFENNTMNGPKNHLDFGDGINCKLRDDERGRRRDGGIKRFIRNDGNEAEEDDQGLSCH